RLAAVGGAGRDPAGRRASGQAVPVGAVSGGAAPGPPFVGPRPRPPSPDGFRCGWSMPGTVPSRGLDPLGFIEREGSHAPLPYRFRPGVAGARDRPLDVFGARLDSAYLYGSIPRGTARPGHSDLDLVAVLHEEPAAADRDAARALGEAVDKEFPQIDGVGTL